MYYNKVEICGVNTAKLSVLTDEQKTELLRRTKAGDAQARQELVYGNLRLVLSIVQRFANRKVLRQAKKDGCFLVSNHTQVQSDSYIGPLGMYPKKCFIISNPHVLSIRGLRLGMQAYGVIPLGSNLEEKKEFLRCVETRLQEGKAVIVYPEAHVWPYYTKIRPFDEQAFCYLSKQKKPMFVLTNCYQKRRFFKRPQIVTYCDGPFYPDPSLGELASAKAMSSSIHS